MIHAIISIKIISFLFCLPHTHARLSEMRRKVKFISTIKRNAEESLQIFTEVRVLGKCWKLIRDGINVLFGSNPTKSYRFNHRTEIDKQHFAPHHSWIQASDLDLYTNAAFELRVFASGSVSSGWWNSIGKYFCLIDFDWWHKSWNFLPLAWRCLKLTINRRSLLLRPPGENVDCQFSHCVPTIIQLRKRKPKQKIKSEKSLKL